MAGAWDTEDWSLQLAAEGATEVSMYDINHAPEEYQAVKKKQLDERRERITGLARKRDKTASLEDLKAKNRLALEELRRKRASALPAGWKMVESRSRPGEHVYENTYTEERQAWIPKEPAVNPNAEKAGSTSVADAIKEKNKKALAARKAKGKGFLPEGWKKVASTSRPGEFVYENIHTEERIAWLPTQPALKEATPQQAPEPAAKTEEAKAAYDYTAATAEEIDLQQGDLVVVELKADNGWWVGTNKRTGALGIFPGGFVELC